MNDPSGWCDFPRTRRGLDTHPWWCPTINAAMRVALTGERRQERQLARARRAAVLRAEGHTNRTIAAWMHVSESTVYNDLALLRASST